MDGPRNSRHPRDLKDSRHPEGQCSTGGASLLLREILRHQGATSHTWNALVDGSDQFDPSHLEAVSLRRLLWVRCRSAAQALHSTDLLARDGNLALVLLDLQGCPHRELCALPAKLWHRLQHAITGRATRLLVFSPHPLVPCAHTRCLLQGRRTWSLADLHHPAAELLGTVDIQVTRWRGGALRSQFTETCEGLQLREAGLSRAVG